MATNTRPARAAGTSNPPAGEPAAAAADQAVTGRWRYTGGVTRTYTTVPVTVAPGDVIEHPDLPAGDGLWEPTSDPATTVPDNTTGARSWTPQELATGALIEDWPQQPADSGEDQADA